MTAIRISRIDASQGTAAKELAALRARLSPSGNVVSEASRAKTLAVFGEALSPEQVVARICQEVASTGIASVLRYSRLLDGAELTETALRVSSVELEAAYRQASPEFLAAIEQIRTRIERFQAAVLPRDVVLPLPHGGHLAQRFCPLQRVGVCVPGGAAAYPSTVLMTVVPAQVAGVKQIAVMAPPTRFGAYNQDLLATCYALGVTEVYRMGGAHGVAALAYGVEGIPAVDKIVGPGNLFVALAKRHVFGQVAIDSIAGPSEVVVVADESAPADWIAADMLAQAEHSPGASVVMSCSAALLDNVEAALGRMIPTLTRGDLARQALEAYGAVVRVADHAQAVELVNELAPEHLHIQTKDTEDLAKRMTTAGAVFVGPYSPVASGDYAAGPSHVLPTSGTARFAAGLTSADFVRGHSEICLKPADLADMQREIQILAEKEGLTAHAESVRIRGDSV